MSTSYALRVPIKVIDQMINVITFRAPTGEDLVGLPDMSSDQIGWAIMLADRVADNVPRGTVKGLPALDAIGAGNAVARELDPTAPASS